MSNMTTQEAISYMQNYPHDEHHLQTFWCVWDMSIAALQASIPHVLTLDEVRALEPHTPVWLEYRVRSIKTITGWKSLCWILYAPAALKRCILRNRISEHSPAARIWGGEWPSEELRAATPWLDDDSSK